MARKYFSWTTTRFGKNGKRISRYRRYGKKTYKTGSTYRYVPKSARNFNFYV